MSKPTIRTLKIDAAFLDVLRDRRSVTAASIDAGISRSTAYEWGSTYDNAINRAPSFITQVVSH